MYLTVWWWLLLSQSEMFVAITSYRIKLIFIHLLSP